jgi:predicted RNA binding protein YcfA (HicA-like mRNA interferase family)
MKRTRLIKTIEEFGCVFVRHGGKHDWYRNPLTGVSQPVPRHREIKEGLARHIIKMLSNPVGGSSSGKPTSEDTT